MVAFTCLMVVGRVYLVVSSKFSNPNPQAKEATMSETTCSIAIQQLRDDIEKYQRNLKELTEYATTWTLSVHLDDSDTPENETRHNEVAEELDILCRAMKNFKEKYSSVGTL